MKLNTSIILNCIIEVLLYELNREIPVFLLLFIKK